jgi:hypothetical protein
MQRGATMTNLELNFPQAALLNLPHKYKAYVAGFGSGKTFVGCVGICMHFWQWPGISQGYFAPTYAQVRDIFCPTMEAVAYTQGKTTADIVREIRGTKALKYAGGLLDTSRREIDAVVRMALSHTG